MKFFNFEQFQIHLGSCTRGNIEQIQAINYEVKYETSEENKFKKVISKIEKK